MNSIALFLSLGLLSAGDDCNGNGIPDEQDIAGGPRFGWLVVSRGRQRLRTRGQTLADFDADGDPDIAIPDLLSRVFLAFGDGAGAFPDSLLFTAGGPHALAIEAGDVDRDGDQDLLAAEFNTGTAVHLLENDGLGTFARQALPPTPSGTSDIVLGDLDGRGNLDCLLIAGNGSAMVLLNERGLEARATVREIPPLSTAAVLTDCDGDGDLDVVLANQERSEISTLRNLEAGRFGMASVMVALPADVIRAADLNQDGAEDLVLAGQQLTTLGSLGNGAFGVVDQHFLEEPARTLDLGDFDRDGRMDAVVSGDRVVVVHRNAGGMVLEPDREYLTGDTFSAVAADDLDRDGDIDLVACGIDGILSSRLNQGDGSFQVPPILRLPAGARALSMVDLDGDGDQEAAMLGDSFGGPSWLFTHENTGDRRFALSQRILCPREHPGRASLAPVDVDVDGDLDLLAAGTNWGAVYVLTHDDRRFSPPQDFFLQAGVGFLLAENLDGDADTDVILGVLRSSRTEPARLVILEVEAGGVARRGEVSPRIEPVAAAAGDLNGDGALDLATAGRFSVTILLGDGFGSFSEDASLLVGSDPFDLALNDLDADGDLDLATANQIAVSQLGGNVTVILNEGRGRFAPGRNYGVTDRPGPIRAADLDGDGFGDLAMAQHLGLAILWSRGAGAFAPAESVGLGSGLAFLQIGDVDGDRDLDLAGVAGGLTVVENRSDARRSPDADGDGVPDECRPEARFRRGDFTGDARLDLADAVAVLGRLFAGESAPDCLEAGDADDSGRLDLTDAVALLRHLFQGGGPLPAPGPGCGLDPTPDALSCDRFAPCG